MVNDKTDRQHGKSAGGVAGGHRHGAFAPVAKAKDAKGTLKRLWTYMRRKRAVLILVFCLVALSTVFTLIGPMLIGWAIDYYIVPQDFKGLAGICLIMLAVFGLGSLSTWLQNHFMVGAAQDIVKEIRKDLFDKLQQLPLKFFDTSARGDLMSRLTNDVDNISQVLNMSTTQIFSSLVTVVGTLVMMIILSPILTLFTVLIIPIMLLATGKIAKRTRKNFMEQQQRLGDLNGFVEEDITGMRVVKVFGHEQESLKEFTRRNNLLSEVSIRAQIFSGIVFPLMNALNNVGFAIVAGIGGYLAVKGVISVGIIASFIAYSKQFTRPLNELANQFNMVQSGLAGAERVFEIMDQVPEPEDEPGAVELKYVAGAVKFKDVYFSYKEGVPVLKNINFDVKPGQTIALVGPTGAGKTTVINLLTRFYDIGSGAITIDGVDIRNIKRKSLRSNLGIVLQDTYLFSESVRDNIRYGRLDATDDEVERAARLANAHHFIKRLPKGYDTVLTDEGSNLSQGQRQLLSIARTILADPAILILDEATSNVDTRTEVHIQEAMLQLMKGRTSFVIAHRLSTIRNADVILVISGGEIIERGSHKELLAQRGFYYNLYTSQLRGEGA